MAFIGGGGITEAWDTEAELLASTPAAPGSLGFAVNEQTLWVWDGSSWIEVGSGGGGGGGGSLEFLGDVVSTGAEGILEILGFPTDEPGDLIVLVEARTDAVGQLDDAAINFGAGGVIDVGPNYDWHGEFSGTSAGSGGGFGGSATITGFGTTAAGDGADADTFGIYEITVPDYTGVKAASKGWVGVATLTTAIGGRRFVTDSFGKWNNVNPVDSVRATPEIGTRFAAGSRLSVWRRKYSAPAPAPDGALGYAGMGTTEEVAPLVLGPVDPGNNILVAPFAIVSANTKILEVDLGAGTITYPGTETQQGVVEFAAYTSLLGDSNNRECRFRVLVNGVPIANYAEIDLHPSQRRNASIAGILTVDPGTTISLRLENIDVVSETYTVIMCGMTADLLDRVG